MSTALLPTDGRTSRGPGVRTAGHEALDMVHDHVLRLVGDPATAARIVTDVALRGAARAEAHGVAMSRTGLLRIAHARLAVGDRQRPSDAVEDRLVGRAPMDRGLVRGLAAAELTGAALLDLTTRHRIDLRSAAAIVGVDRGTAAAAREAALAVVRAHLADAGADLEVDVPAALARLPIASAPDRLHDLLPAPAGSTGARSVHPVLAWAASATVIVATMAGVGVALPQLAAADHADAPVVTAEMVVEGPAARQLATPGDDAAEVEQLVVQPPAPEAGTSDDTAADAAAQPTVAETSSPGEPEPTPAPTPSPTTQPDQGGSEQPDPDPAPEPDPEPTEGPLGVDLPGNP